MGRGQRHLWLLKWHHLVRTETVGRVIELWSCEDSRGRIEQNCAVGESKKEDWETIGHRCGRWLYSL